MDMKSKIFAVAVNPYPNSLALQDTPTCSSVPSAGYTGGGDAAQYFMGSGQEPASRPMTHMWNRIMRNIGGPNEMTSALSQHLNNNNQSPLKNYGGPVYSRKIFVGGLPQDIDDRMLCRIFSRFGPVVIDWPHKNRNRFVTAPQGFAFLLFSSERSVQYLMDNCHNSDGRLYISVTSSSVPNKLVEVRAWRLIDADHVVDPKIKLDLRRTVFVGGVPRPLTAQTLATTFERLYGGVCYAGIETDPELKYPKGAGRVAFNNDDSYQRALARRFVRVRCDDVDKRVEVKPFLLDNQMCEKCGGNRNDGRFATLYCSDHYCRKYFCDQCWFEQHAVPGFSHHKPLVRECTERLRYGRFRDF